MNRETAEGFVSHLPAPPLIRNGSSISSATVVRLMRRREPVVMPQQNETPRVQVFPSADGTVLLVGVTPEGVWVAEYRCRAEDFDERCVKAMERRVRAKEKASPRLVAVP